MKPERKNRMIIMRKRLQNELATVMEMLQMNPSLNTHIFFMLKERVNHFGIRSFFVHTMSHYVKEQAKIEGIALRKYPDKLFETQLPFLAEGIITVQYYENQILDGKGGLFRDGNYDMDKIHRNVIAGHYVKDFLYRYIEEKIFYSDCLNYRLTMKKVHKIFQLVDLGQAFQDKWGTYEAFKSNDKQIPITREADNLIDKDIITSYWETIREQGLTSERETFTCNYLRRIYLTSGALFVLMAELVMDLLNYYGKERANILKFAAQVGMTGQIVNDINDFVPAECNIATMSKIPEDAFADIRNNNITLPLIFHYHSNPRQTISQVQSEIKKPSDLLRSIGKAIQAAQEVAQQMAENSRQLVKSDGNAGALLCDLNSIAFNSTNRYYQALGKFLKESVAMEGTATPISPACFLQKSKPASFFKKLMPQMYGLYGF